MNLLIHTKAFEPFGSAQEDSLEAIIPALEEAGFYLLEIAESHLIQAPSLPRLKQVFDNYFLKPMVLSSGLDPALAVQEEDYRREVRRIAGLVRYFGFKKIGLIPGKGIPPSDFMQVGLMAERIRILAEELPLVEILLETSGGSIADDPYVLCNLIQMIDRKNVGLLWEPTVYETDAALAQFVIQWRYIRHFHLFNRDAAGRPCRLRSGVVPWEEILAESGYEIDATLALVLPAKRSEERLEERSIMEQLTDEFKEVVQFQG